MSFPRVKYWNLGRPYPPRAGAKPQRLGATSREFRLDPVGHGVGVTPVPSARLRGAVAAAAVLLLAAGCGDGGGGASPPDPSASGSPTESSPHGLHVTQRVGRAASGPLLDGGSATVNAPEGYKLMEDLVSWLKTAQEPTGFSRVSLAVTPSAGTVELDELARVAQKSAFEGKDGKRLPDTEVGGVDFYRVAGPGKGGLYVEELGTAYNGELVKVIFELDDLELSAGSAGLMDSVLASFAWA